MVERPQTKAFITEIQAISSVPQLQMGGLTWSQDPGSVISPGETTGVWRIPSQGIVPTRKFLGCRPLDFLV